MEGEINMRRQEVIQKLAAHRDEIRSMGVRSLGIFGSAARDETTDQSDVDLLIEFTEPVGLFHFARVRRRLTTILGKPVDLVTPSALRKEMREHILRETIHAA